MNVMMCVGFAAVLAIAQPASTSNPLLEELLKKGVAMSDGSAIPLSPPWMADGLTAAAQRKVVDALVGPKRTFDDMAQRSLQAPVLINIHSPGLKDESVARVLDVGFIAYADWNRIRSNQFLEGLLRSGQQETTAGRVGRSGTISPAELEKRGINRPPNGGSDESYFFSTMELLDRVEASSTRRSVATRGANGFLLASQVDPRFNDDSKYPNQWRPLLRRENGELVPGKAQPYTATGFYVKVTRLVQPVGAIFIEYHMVFEEPHGWFSGGPQLRSKLPLLIQDDVRTLRRRLSAPAALKPAPGATR